MTIRRADREHYFEEGYIVLRRAYDPGPLHRAVLRMIDRAAAGEFEIRWIDRERKIPNRTGHMMHPDKYDPAFAAWIDGCIADQVEALLDQPARHSLFGMLASGGGQAYFTGWHRDLAKPGAASELPVMRWASGQFVQFNAPVLPGDRFVHIVPRSHRRVSTEQELAVFATKEKNDDMPDQLVVELEPGDIVYYDANLWHRGYNMHGVMRWSLHAAYWRADQEIMAHETGQQEALRQPGHIDRMPARTRALMQRYLDAKLSASPPTLEQVIARGTGG